MCRDGVRHARLLWGFKDNVLHLLLCHKGEGFKTGTTEDQEVRLSRRSIKRVPQPLELCREEISKRIWEVNSGDGTWEGAVLLLACQLVCDVEEILARTALDLVGHIVVVFSPAGRVSSHSRGGG